MNAETKRKAMRACFAFTDNAGFGRTVMMMIDDLCDEWIFFKRPILHSI